MSKSGLDGAYKTSSVGDLNTILTKAHKNVVLDTSIIIDSNAFDEAFDSHSDLVGEPKYYYKVYSRFLGVNGGTTHDKVEDRLQKDISKVMLNLEYNSQTDKTLYIICRAQGKSYGEKLPSIPVKIIKRKISARTSELSVVLPRPGANHYYPVVEKSVIVGAATVVSKYLNLFDFFVTGEMTGLTNDAVRSVTAKPSVILETYDYKQGAKADPALPTVFVESIYTKPSLEAMITYDNPHVKYLHSDRPFKIMGKHIAVDVDDYPEFEIGQVYTMGVPGTALPVTGYSSEGLSEYFPQYFRCSPGKNLLEKKKVLTLHDTYTEALTNIGILSKSGLNTVHKTHLLLRSGTLFIPRDDFVLGNGSVVSSSFFKYPKKTISPTKRNSKPKVDKSTAPRVVKLPENA